MATPNVKKLATLTAITILLGACATTPPTYPELNRAREVVTSAQSTPDAARYAPLELQKANGLLEQATEAAKAKNVDVVRHYAYLATQKSKVALSNASAKAAEARLANGDAERQRVQLEVRTREAEVARHQATAATTALKLAESELADLNAKQTDRGLVVTLGDVLFDTGKAELKSGASRSIGSFARFLDTHPERRVLVEGFTDSVGSDEYNRGLSQRRADAVKSGLIARGIASDRIETSGLGKEYPVASNQDAAGRQLNRRVELTISDENGRVAPR